MATIAILALSACAVLDPDEPASEIEYARATAMLRACPTIAGIVRDALSDPKLTTGESRRIGVSHGTACGRMRRAEVRAEAMAEAGLKKTVALPATCFKEDPRTNSDVLLEDWANWGYEHGD